MQRRRTRLAVLHELQTEWDQAIAEGTSRLTQIANALQKETYADGESWGVLAEATGLHTELRHKLQREAHFVQRNLSVLIDRLAEVVARMRHLCGYEAMPSIEIVQVDPDPSATLSTFQSEAYVRELVHMYEAELLAKTLLVTDVLDCAGHNAALLYVASWQMQPFVSKARVAEITALLTLDANPKKLAPSASHKLVR
ncbi:hypothetical protein SDRG_01002 [Saprolegnia diclina VS20]|uniref:Uncharacterized protein n=1 Tax=Saprolegnia diclina (strain VS20) TaxID=1156394 RepID=T0SGU1_SAPDV|nr:hypothetical protein SDRG_01002 [Saprolegnia diclina VS20]EQC42162.1 hypothetical protein SDRG_01002 [Saprolegnia diclina VS20]|eukprot:XP_008604731.1 hypothetical protein SDRG_01002 [Saprolegnia diclina VS20]